MNPMNYLTALLNKGVKRKAVREHAVSGGAAGQMAEMSLVQHVIELRKHVVRSVLYYVVFAGIAMGFMSDVIAFLRRPYEIYRKSVGKDPQLLSIGLFEVVMMNFKICLIVGLVASAPFMVRELWRFVSPALYESEKRIARPVVFASILLFYTGISFGYFVIVPEFLANTLEWGQEYARVELTVGNYFDSLSTMVMLFGIIFEVPVIMSLLGLAGVVTSSLVSKNRRVVFLLSFVVGAILSPPDAFSQVIVSVPLYLMCELSVVALRIIERNRAKMSAAEQQDSQPPSGDNS